MDATDGEGATPLHSAARHGHTQVRPTHYSPGPSTTALALAVAVALPLALALALALLTTPLAPALLP